MVAVFICCSRCRPSGARCAIVQFSMHCVQAVLERWGLGCIVHGTIVPFGQLHVPHRRCLKPPLSLVCVLQKNAVAVAYCKRGKGEMRLNGEQQAGSSRLEGQKVCSVPRQAQHRTQEWRGGIGEVVMANHDGQ